MDAQHGDKQTEVGVPIEQYRGPKLYGHEDLAIESRRHPRFMWPDERSDAAQLVYTPPNDSFPRMTMRAMGALLAGWVLSWSRLVTHPFRANDQALGWAKQGTAWVALAWLMLVNAGNSGLFYAPGGCAWLFFVAPALVGLVYIINSWNIVRQSRRRIATVSILILGVAAITALMLESGFVSKAGELLGNLEECCCYTCTRAAVQWYLGH